jgi:DNA topoisomerase-1
MKFEKARKLVTNIAAIRENYEKDWLLGYKGNEQAVERSCALYLIDKLALRVGGEKSEDEADTVGCCSLRKEHVTFVPADPDKAQGDPDAKVCRNFLYIVYFLCVDRVYI